MARASSCRPAAAGTASRTGIVAAPARRTRVIWAAAAAGSRGGARSAAAISAASGGRMARSRGSACIRDSRMDGEVNRERRAAFRTRDHADLAAVRGDDLTCDEEPETAPGVLRREEWVEDLLQVLRGDARARVGDD